MGWILQKGLCVAGWPEDCASDCDEQHTWGWSCTGLPWTIDKLGEAHGLQQLLVYGLLSGWFNAIGRPKRFSYLFSPTSPSHVIFSTGSHSQQSQHSSELGLASTAADRQPLIESVEVARRAPVYGRSWRQRCRLPWFPLVYLFTIPVFSRITMCDRNDPPIVPALVVRQFVCRPIDALDAAAAVVGTRLDFMKRSLSPGFSDHPGFVQYLMVLGSLGLIALIVLGWHAVYIWRHCNW